MNKITFTGKRKDNGNIISGYYLCLHQTDDADLHIIVDEHGEYNPIDPESLTNDAEKAIPDAEELVSLKKVLEIVSQYCPDDDGSCSKAGIDLREMLDEIESIDVVTN